MNGREDEEGTVNVTSEYESVRVNVGGKMGTVKTLKLRKMIGMVNGDW
jgi:hypothetical protein